MFIPLSACFTRASMPFFLGDWGSFLYIGARVCVRACVCPHNKARSLIFNATESTTSTQSEPCRGSVLSNTDLLTAPAGDDITQYAYGSKHDPPPQFEHSKGQIISRGFSLTEESTSPPPPCSHASPSKCVSLKCYTFIFRRVYINIYIGFQYISTQRGNRGITAWEK